MGRSVAGGRSMGSIEGLGGSGGLYVLIGWTGVPKAGEEEGMGFESGGF